MVWELKTDNAIRSGRKVAVPRRKLITKGMEDPEVDLVGAVRIDRVPIRVDIGGVVVEQIKDKIAFMLVGANDFGIDRDMVANQRQGGNAFFETEIFRGMSGVDGIALRFETLTIAA